VDVSGVASAESELDISSKGAGRRPAKWPPDELLVMVLKIQPFERDAIEHRLRSCLSLVGKAVEELGLQ
jgi:hypothetical protein